MGDSLHHDVKGAISADTPAREYLYHILIYFIQIFLLVKCIISYCMIVFDWSYLWLVGNGGMGYNYNYYYYHSSIPFSPKVGSRVYGAGV